MQGARPAPHSLGFDLFPLPRLRLHLTATVGPFGKMHRPGEACKKRIGELAPDILCQTSFWAYEGSMDIVTDLMLVTLPFYTLMSIQLLWRRRLQVIIPFTGRLG